MADSENFTEPAQVNEMSEEDRAFYEQCLLEIGASLGVGENLSTTTTTISSLSSLSTFPTSSLLSNMTTDEMSDNDSPFSACMTILNFKKNPHMVLPQTTIYAIIGVYR